MANKCPVCKSKKSAYIKARVDMYDENILTAYIKGVNEGNLSLCVCLDCGTVYISERTKEYLREEFDNG